MRGGRIKDVCIPAPTGWGQTQCRTHAPCARQPAAGSALEPWTASTAAALQLSPSTLYSQNLCSYVSRSAQLCVHYMAAAHRPSDALTPGTPMGLCALCTCRSGTADGATDFVVHRTARASESAAEGAYPELLVVEPAPIPELIRSQDLRLIVGHRVEDVEQRVRLELAEVARL